MQNEALRMPLGCMRPLGHFLRLVEVQMAILLALARQKVRMISVVGFRVILGCW